MMSLIYYYDEKYNMHISVIEDSLPYVFCRYYLSFIIFQIIIFLIGLFFVINTCDLYGFSINLINFV